MWVVTINLQHAGRNNNDQNSRTQSCFQFILVLQRFIGRRKYYFVLTSRLNIVLSSPIVRISSAVEAGAHLSGYSRHYNSMLKVNVSDCALMYLFSVRGCALHCFNLTFNERVMFVIFRRSRTAEVSVISTSMWLKMALLMYFSVTICSFIWRVIRFHRDSV